MNNLLNKITAILVMISFAVSLQVAEAPVDSSLRAADLDATTLARTDINLVASAKFRLSAQTALVKNDYKAFVANLNSDDLKTWTAKLADGLDYSNDAALRGLLGAQVDDADANVASLADVPKESARLLGSLPTTYDLRSAYPGCWSIKYIRNQAQCGSCWAVAGATSLSDRSCINKPSFWFLSVVQKKRSFSYQDPLECCSLATCGTGPNKGCNGGKITGAFAFAQQTGIVTGENFGNTTNCKNYFLAPYQAAAPAPSCRLYCTTPGYGVAYTPDKRKILGYKVYSKSALGTSGVVSAMKSAIYSRGTVTAFMNVYSDFFAYSGGVYTKTAGAVLKGGHAVRVIGWSVSSIINVGPFKIALGAYWICANSWGTNWGINGFFHIRRGTNEADIESYVVEGYTQ